MNFTDLKQKVAISDFLRRMGAEPIRRSGGELHYIAPYREDTNPSLSVNDDKGFWYDHGLGRGGTVVDLAMLVYHIASPRDAARQLQQDMSLGGVHVSSQPTRKKSAPKPEEPKHYSIVSVRDLGKNQAISGYLEQRGVYDQAVRSGVIRELYYEIEKDDGKKSRYFGAGWFNDSGGVEIRSALGKTCLFSKDVTLMPGRSGQINIFEGMMDFLSAMKERTVSLRDQNIVLNTLSISRRLYDDLHRVDARSIHLFLDYGQGGQAATEHFQAEFPGCQDCRNLYLGFDDYNDKIMVALKSGPENRLSR